MLQSLASTAAPRPRRRRFVLVGILLIGGITIAALLTLVIVTGRASASVPALQSVPGAFSRIHLTAEASDVTVEYGDIDQPEVRFDQGQDARAFQLDARIDADGVLHIDLRQSNTGGWQFGAWGQRSPSLRLTLPKTVQRVPDLTVQAAAGDVMLDGDFQRLDVAVQAGHLTLEGSAQRIVVEADAAHVRALEYRVAQSAVIDSIAGDSELHFASLPELIEIDATAGDIAVRLPHGEYQIQAEADLGQLDIAAVSTPGADRRYTFSSTAGAIKVTH